MYTAFYGLREKPFALSPDPRFLFLSESHREALAHLLYGIEQGEGFIAITGEVGTGKTTLCRALLRRLGPDVEVAFLFNPQLSADELIRAIHVELGIESLGETLRELMDELNRFLLEKQIDGRRVLLVIDEAQGLAPETLEQVRLLSNLETESEKLIQILLLGQPELDEMLESASLRQLRQRIGVRWRLASLSARETRAYVRHRLRVAARAERDLFSEGALRAVHRRGRGIPRLVNLLCDRALLAGYAARSGRLAARHVRQADGELRRGATGGARRGRGTLRLGWILGAAVGGLAALVVLWGASPGLSTQELGLPIGRAAARLRDLVPRERPAAPNPEDLDPQSALPIPAEATTAPPGVGAAPEALFPETGRATEEPPIPPADARSRVAATGWQPVSGPPAAPGAAEPVPAEGDLALRLARHLPGATAAAALRAVLDAWELGIPTPQSELLSLDTVLETLRARALGVHALAHTDLRTLRALDHPALLPLRAADGVERVVALRALDAERALIAGVSLGESVWISQAELARNWNGAAFIVWQDFEGLPDLVDLGDTGASVAWLQFSLRELGFYDGALSARFEKATRAAVRSFQGARGLPRDGAVGPLTKMALYDALPRYPTPRLAALGGPG